MSAQALVCLAPGSEETEAVTTIDLLVRGGIKVTTASVASDGNLTIVCSRGVKLLADAPLVEVADGDFDIIVLPGGIKGAECFRDSPLLVETVKQFHRSGRIVAAICAAAATVSTPTPWRRVASACTPGGAGQSASSQARRCPGSRARACSNHCSTCTSTDVFIRPPPADTPPGRR